ncbi:MAG TPA: carboxypeptidase-like regulatory domain-containing protein [Planctomycetaceae bacterium]|nr:carboxypeptidase-like regulatory domain-containing protein [Planctomycetaceae bacterium]
MRTTTTTTSSRFRPTYALILCVLLCIGCEGQSNRLPLTGTVTDRDGEPLEGSISFLPDGGTEGPAANASVLNGEYRFDRTNGPVAGMYRVIVSPLVDKAEWDDQPKTIEVATFQAEVTRDQLTRDFELR